MQLLHLYTKNKVVVVVINVPIGNAGMLAFISFKIRLLKVRI